MKFKKMNKSNFKKGDKVTRKQEMYKGIKGTVLRSRDGKVQVEWKGNFGNPKGKITTWIKESSIRIIKKVNKNETARFQNINRL